jgi:hypothetical protein
MSALPTEARLMDGTAASRALLAETTRRAGQFANEAGQRPCLAAALVGEDRPR